MNDPTDSTALHARATEALWNAQKFTIGEMRILGAALATHAGAAAEPSVEQVERELGMGHGAWDMEDPAEIISTVLRLAALTSAPAEPPKGLTVQEAFASSTVSRYVDGANQDQTTPPQTLQAAGAIDARGQVRFEVALPYLQERLQDHTCTRVENAGSTPDLTLYKMKIGAHPEYQLYETEAFALWTNLGKALAPILASRAAPQASGDGETKRGE